jgi:hypothetical protein
MLDSFARFISLFCMGLAAGITLCVLLTERLLGGTARFYIELKQLWIRVLTVPGPGLGAVGLLAMLIDGALLFTRGIGLAFWLVAMAVLLNIAAMLLTKLGHFPINDQIRTWDPANPPSNWSSVRARWFALHTARTICAVASFALLLVSNLLRG